MFNGNEIVEKMNKIELTIERYLLLSNDYCYIYFYSIWYTGFGQKTR